MSETRPPRDNIVRAVFPGAEVRDDAAGNGTLFGHFAKFNEWTKIDSVFEGRFMERIAPGAFAKTFDESRGRVRITLNHGQDPDLGDKPIAAPEILREDAEGAYYEAPLLDGVPPLVVAGLRAGQYGASFRFRVTRDDTDRKAKVSEHNPDGLPERTIREVDLYEFGPVTYPAYAGATAGVRSLTDDYYRRLMPDAPSVDAGASPHLEPERRDDPEPPPPEPEETPAVGDITELRTLDEMEARTRELDEEIKRAAEIPGILPDKEQAAFDEKVAERAKLDHAMTSWRNRLAQVRGDAPFEPTAPAVIVRKTESDIYDLDAIERSSRSSEDRGQKLRDAALRAADQLRVYGPRYDQDKSRERLADLVDFVDSDDKEIALRVLQTNSPQYRAAFNRYVKSGGQERGTALAVGVDGTGGFAVPVSFDPTVIAIGAWTAINPFRSACRVETISGTDTYQALTSTAVTVAYALEAAAATEGGPTFARPEFIAKRCHGFVTASYEMVQDRADLASEMGTLFGEARDTYEENQFTIGIGTTVFPQGIGLKDAITRVDSVGNDVVAVADIRAVEAALPIRHRFGAAWFLSRAAIRAIQAFETTGGQLFNGTNYAAVGNPANQAQGNTGLTLLGYPIYENPSMPWTPTTDDTTYGVLMNPRSCYLIVDRIGMSVRVIPDMLNGATPSFPTGEIGIYAFWRNTARVLNADAGRQGAVQ